MADTTATATETVSKADFDAAVARAQRFEGMVAELNNKFKGIMPEQVTALKAENDALKLDAAGGDKTKIDAILADKTKELDARYGSKFEELSGENNSLKGEVKQLKVVNVAVQKAAEIFNADALPLIRREIEQDCDYQEGVIVVKGSDGKPLMSKADPRVKMTLEEYLGDVAKKFPSTVKPRGKTGTMQPGGSTSTADVGSLTPESYLAMTPEQRRELPREVRQKMAPLAVRVAR